jgi:hypothetical protein
MPFFTTSRDSDTFAVHTPELTLAFSLEDGGLRTLRRAGGSNVIGYGAPVPSIDVQIDARDWLAERTFVRYLNHSVEERDGAVEVVIIIGIGPLMVYDRYRITGTLIARRASLVNSGEDDVQLRGVRLSLPWARVGAADACRFEAPGNGVRPHVPLAVAAAQRRNLWPRRFFAPALREGQALEPAPMHGAGLLALHDPSSEEALLCWFHSSTDMALPQVHGNDTAVTLAHEIAVADWLRSEVALSAGTQYIVLLREPWPAALAALRRTWPLCGLRAIEQPAAWVHDAAIYEVHPAQVGGFRGLAAALPDLQSLGLNTLCLLPIWPFANRSGRLWDGNWEVSGNPYAVADFDAPDPQLGPPEDLEALVAAAHRHGMRVLVDLPLAGCAAAAPLVEAHPDWFCYDENGRLARLPEQDEIAAYDWSNPDLRAHTLSWALAQARAYGLDGYRAIVPRAVVPNWRRAGRGHASAGGMGVLELLERLQRELKWIRHDAVLLGDQSGPAYAASYDFTLDHLPHHMFVHLALNRVVPGELGEWLDDHRQVLPYEVARVGYTETHQTRLSNPLADGLRGSRISRMIFAGLVFCGFVPLVRAGQEREEGEWIARVLRARAEHPALRRGQPRYNALPCSSSQVFGVLREHAGEHLLALLNVSAHKQTVVISIPVDQLALGEGDYELYGVLDGSVWCEAGRRSWRRDELLAIRLTLEPFAAYCLHVRPALADRPADAATPTASAIGTAEPIASVPAEGLPPVMAVASQAVGQANGRRASKRKREPPS